MAARVVGTVVARAVEMEAATAVVGEAAAGTAMAMEAMARAGNRPPRLRAALKMPILVQGAAGQPAAMQRQSESAMGAASRKNLPTADMSCGITVAARSSTGQRRQQTEQESDLWRGSDQVVGMRIVGVERRRSSSQSTAACVLLVAPTFCNIAVTWFLTVFS